MQTLAESGSVEGACGFAFCLSEGEVVPEDPERAEQYYMQAARAGCAQSMHQLGLMKYLGGASDEETHEAVRLFSKSRARVGLGLVTVTLSLRDRACTSPDRPPSLAPPSELRLPPLVICAVASSLPPQSGGTVTRRPAFVSGAQKGGEASRRCFLLFAVRCDAHLV